MDSSRHQHSSDQMKILKEQSAQTTARVVSVAYRLWLPFLINRVLNLTMLRSVIYDQSVDSNLDLKHLEFKTISKIKKYLIVLKKI